MDTVRSRRWYLHFVGAGAVLGLAGCSDTSNDGGDDDTDTGDDGSDDEDGAADTGGTGEGDGETGNDDGTGDDDDTDDDDDEGTDGPRLRDVFRWENAYVMEIESDEFTGTWRFHDDDWHLTATSNGDVSETYSIGTAEGRDTYVVSDGQCFKTATPGPGDDAFDPEDPADDDKEYYASDRTTIDGEEVSVFEIEDGTYYISVGTGYPVRFESAQGEEVVQFHSWGSTDPITPPAIDCVET